MIRAVTIFCVGAIFALLLAGVVAAQTGNLASVAQPFVVDVEQSMPVDLELTVPLDNGSVVTVTTPITLRIAIQLSVEGRQLSKIVAGEVEQIAGEVTTENNSPKTQAVAEIVLPKPTSVPGALDDAQVLEEISAAEDVCRSDMTSALKERSLEKHRMFFEEREIMLSGTIKDVRNIFGYDAVITLDAIGKEVLVEDVSEEVALSLRIGEKITFTGQLDIGPCGMYMQLRGKLETR